MARRLSEASRDWLRRSLGDFVSIDFFAADRSAVELGEETRLRWSVANADQVRIEPDVGDVPAEGSQLVLPVCTTDFTLTAAGNSGSVRQVVRVRVRPIRLAAPPQLTREAPRLAAERLRLVAWPRERTRLATVLGRLRDRDW